MNQILATQKNQKSKGIDAKKIIIFFCVLIALFGIILVIIGLYNIQKNKKEEVEKIPPEVSFEQNEDEVLFNVKSKTGIQSVKYKINNGDNIVMQVYNKTEWEKTIKLENEGNSIFEFTITLADNSAYNNTKVFTYESNLEIELFFTEGSDEIKIVATDDVEVNGITYNWNNEEAVEIEQTTEDKTRLEQVIKIKRGKNIITIVATDNAGNKKVKEQEFLLTKKPAIDIYKDNNQIVVRVSHDIGIVKTQVTINEQKYAAEEEGTFLEYRLPLQEGENIIEVITYSSEDTFEVVPARYDNI